MDRGLMALLLDSGEAEKRCIEKKFSSSEDRLVLSARSRIRSVVRNLLWRELGHFKAFTLLCRKLDYVSIYAFF